MIENEKMTIFYYKDNGDVFCIISQVTDFKCFPRLGEAYKLVMDYIVLDYDNNVIMHPDLFRVDENKQIKIKGSY
jgi:hypothetical protein